MKKIFIAIIISISITHLALACVSYVSREIIFSFGLPESSLNVWRESVGIIEIKADNPEQIKINQDIKSSYSDKNNTLSLRPGNPDPGNYEYWVISGTLKDKKFFIFGYTFNSECGEGEEIMIMDILKIVSGIILFIVAIFFIRKNLKNFQHENKGTKH